MRGALEIPRYGSRGLVLTKATILGTLVFQEITLEAVCSTFKIQAKQLQKQKRKTRKK